MRHFSIVLATILGVAFASPVDVQKLTLDLESTDVDNRNSALEELLLGVLDELRALMINGSGDVPVLDPFQLDELNLDGDLVADIINMPNSHINLKDISVLNLSTFEVNEIGVSLVNLLLQRYRVTFDAKIPDLEVNTDNYDMAINVFGGNIFGNGQMKVNIINPRIHGFMQVRLRISLGGIFLSVEDCRIGFTLDAFQANITGFMNNNAVSNFVSAFLRNLMPELVEFFEEEITDILSTTIQTIANEILDGLNIGSLLPLEAIKQ